jgi:hypothetical protein
MKSLGLCTFFGCGPYGLHQGLFWLCATPPALDVLLVERHPALAKIAAQHRSNPPPWRNQTAIHLTTQLPAIQVAEEKRTWPRSVAKKPNRVQSEIIGFLG